MPVLKPKEFLEYLNEGGTPTKAHLDDLKQLPKESLYHDFKDGQLAQKPKAFRDTLRQYVSAFANSDGGMIIVGVGDVIPRAYTPTVPMRGTTLAAWARDVLIPLLPYLSPLPRIHVVQCDGHEVLVVATTRSPLLVPCPEKGGISYWLRFEDGCFRVPEYLASDLILGRRSHPLLSADSIFFTLHKSQPGSNDHIQFEAAVSNIGLLAASDLEIGYISWGIPFHISDSTRNMHITFATSAAHSLRGFVQAGDCEDPVRSSFDICHFSTRGRSSSGGSYSLYPFRELRAVTIQTLIVPPGIKNLVAHFAMYVHVTGHPPIWFQGQLTIKDGQLDSSVAAHRVVDRLPQVDWRRIQ